MIEKWKDIPGYEGLYQVSDMGSVKSCQRVVTHPRWGFQTIHDKILKHGFVRGYHRVVLCNTGVCKNYFVHQLVLKAFTKSTDWKYTVNHIDSDMSNNFLTNLEWATNKENSEHAARFGDIKRGSGHPAAKLHESDIPVIRADKRMYQDIAADFGVTACLIGQIKRKTSWAHV